MPRKGLARVDGFKLFKITDAAIKFAKKETLVYDHFKQRIARRINLPRELRQFPVTMRALNVKLAALGYKLDPACACLSSNKHLTGERAGKSYPAKNAYIVESDTGISFAHYAKARRDLNYTALQEMRKAGEVFAVSRGRIMGTLRARRSNFNTCFSIESRTRDAILTGVEYMTTNHKSEVITRLAKLGIDYRDAEALRRISMTLRRWFEYECGTGEGQTTYSIERETEEPDLWLFMRVQYPTL